MLALALATLMSSAPPGVAVSLTAVGIDDDDKRAALAALQKDLVDHGAFVVAVGDDAGSCGGASSCLSSWVQRAGADVGLAVSLVRVGAKVRVAVQLVPKGGAVVDVAPKSVRAADLRSGARILDDDAHARIAASAPRSDPPPAPPPPRPAPPPTPPPSVVEEPPPPVVEPPPPAPVEHPASTPAPMAPSSTGAPYFGPLFFAGLGTATVGTFLAVAGASVAIEEAVSANSPDSTGEAKERARWLGPAAVVVGAAGVAAIAGGAALLAVGLLPE